MKEKLSYMSYAKTFFQVMQTSVENFNCQQTYNAKRHQPSSYTSQGQLVMPQLIQSTNRNQKVTEEEI